MSWLRLGLRGFDGACNVSHALTQVGSTSDWAGVSASYGHTSALKKDSSLRAWSLNDAGQLGIGDTIIYRDTPTEVGNATDWIAVSGGAASHHTLALKNDGTLWALGWNLSGQLGLGDTADRWVRTLIGGP